ncbi:MAG: hypothetical protein HY370_08215 [Proteobacteria bacterium]|nr:hypothetical protein [Pseudomonadota bacterium]
MRALFFCAALMLAGCGFSPLYGSRGDAAAVPRHFDSVSVGNIPNREGQYLRNALIDRLYSSGRPVAPRYELHVSPVRETLTDLDITKSSSATRAQLRLNAEMKLRNSATGEAVLERGLTAITSYNILQSRFTTRVSEDDARRAALDDLARQAEQQLALYFNGAGP